MDPHAKVGGYDLCFEVLGGGYAPGGYDLQRDQLGV